ELLIKHDANIYIRDADGRIPLDVVGDDPKSICISNTRQKIIFILECADKEVNCQTLASRANPKVIEASNHSSYHNSTSVLSGTVKPSSFINNILSWVTTATLSSLFSSAPALPSAQQSVDHLDGSPIGSSQVDFNGTALLTDVMIRKFTGKKYSSLLEDSLLTIEEIRERKLNTIEKNFETALSKCEKLYQCPESSLSNLTISKGMHQKSL
ncbi:MAG: ankyrin repeat domain-containing protein, partial [Wolbachia sp.]